MLVEATYPTPEHQAAEVITDFFNRLYNACRQFLQALFIARRTYPTAYDKWIHEQVVEILGLPELYEQLTHLFEIRKFESRDIADKAIEVKELLKRYAPSPDAG